MESIPINFSVEQILALTRQLPKELKLLLLQEWGKEFKMSGFIPQSPTLSIEGYDEPFDLDKANFSKGQLKPLHKLWEGELPAEELVKLL